MNNETECLIQRQVSIQSTSSGFKINLLDGNDKNNLKYKFKKAIEGDLDYFEFWLKLIRDVKDKSAQEIEEKKRCLKSIQNARDENKLSVLHYAAKNFHKKLCKLLVEDYEMDFGMRKEIGLVEKTSKRAPIHELLDCIPPLDKIGNQIELLEYFVKKNVDVNLTDKNGYTPLHLACKHNNTKAVEFLVNEKKIKINLKNKEKKTPLEIALEMESDVGIANLLVEKFEGNDLDNSFVLRLLKLEKTNMVEDQDIIGKLFAKIRIFANLGTHKMLDKFSTVGKMVNFYDEKEKITPLELAIGKELTSIALVLINSGAELNFPNGENAVTCLARSCSLEMLDKLNNKLDLFARNSNGQNAIHIAALTKSQTNEQFAIKYIETAEKKSLSNKNLILDLLNKRDQTSEKEWPLSVAIKNNCCNLVDMLIKKDKKQLHIINDEKSGNNLTHLLAEFGSIEMLAMFQTNNFNIFAQNSVKNKQNQNMLHLAVIKNHSKQFIETLKELLEGNNQNIQNYLDAADKFSFIPLYYSIKNNNTEVAELLLSYYETIDELNNSVLTEHIAKYGSIEMLNLLVRKFDIKLEINTKAAQIAFKNGQFDILVELVRSNSNFINLLENDKDGNSLFHICAQDSNIKGFKYLVKNLDKLQDEAAAKSIKECLSQLNSFNQTILHVACYHGHFDFVKEILEINYDFPGIDKFRSDLVFAVDNEEDNCLCIALDGFKLRQGTALEAKRFQDIANYLWTKYYDLEFKFKRAKEGHLEYFKYLYDDLKISDILSIDPNKSKKSFLTEQHSNIKLEIKNAKCKEDNLRSVIHYAAKHGHLNVCQFFIETHINQLYIENKNYKINITDKHGKTPLNLIIEEYDQSSSTKQIDMIKYFISSGADIHHEDKRGYSVLDYIVIMDDREAAKYLLEHFELTVGHLEDTLIVALDHGSSGVARLLIDKMSPNSFESMLIKVKPFHAISCFRSNSEKKLDDLVKLMEYLIGKISSSLLDEILATKDQYEFMPLHLAFKNNNFKLVQLLEKNNAKFHYTGGPFANSMIHFAAQGGSIEMLNLLKNKKSDTLAKNSRNETALHIAVLFRNYKFVEEFKKVDNDIKRDKNVDIEKEVDIDGLNVIHLCARETNIKSFEYLIKTLPASKRLDVIQTKVSTNHDNILHIATRNNNFEFVKEILNFRFMRQLEISKTEMNSLTENLVYARNNSGQTCFHIAAALGNRSILNYLLNQENLDPDHLITDKDNKLNTALHLACLNNQEKIVRSLLKYNLDLNEKNIDFLSVIDICCLNGAYELTKLILEQNPLRRSVNINKDHDNIDHPLKLACESGNSLLLKYLINNGSNLNFKIRNESNMNVLDNAIAKKDKQIVKTLLVNDSERVLLKEGLNQTERFKKLCFEMPDLLKLVFDQLEKSGDMESLQEFDPPLSLIKDKAIQNHPLFLVAESNNRQLLSHNVINQLLDYKWLQIPIWLYYINLILYICFLLPLTFLVLFTTNKQNRIESNNKTLSNMTNSTFYLMNYSNSSNGLIALEPITIVFLIINFGKEIVQCFFVNGVRYMYELDNIIEIVTYIFSFIFLFPSTSSSSFYKSEFQRTLAPLCGLSSWLVLALFIQKVPYIGIFGVMFKKILHKSFKFFPIFSIFILGFSLSFSIQKKQITETNLNSTASFLNQIQNTFTMIVGELSLEISDLSVFDSVSRRLVFFFYVSIMCIMILNLMIGIAVGEIREVMDEADTSSVAMRIKFSLRVQYCLAYFGDYFENQMMYSSKQSLPRYETIKRIIAKLKKFFKYKESRKKVKEKEVIDGVIDHLNSISEQLENFKFTIDNKLNLINFEISEIRLDLNAVKAELKNRNSTSYE